MPFFSRWSQKVGLTKCINMENLLETNRKKGGRPPKKIKREQIIMVRLSKTEHFIINSKAGSAGMKISDWFRHAAKSAKILPRLNSDDLKLYRTLAGMANNLNQLTKLAHEKGLLIFQKRCRETLDGINGLLNNCKNDGEDCDR